MVPYLTPWAHLGSYVKGGVMDTDRSKNIDHGRLDGLRRGRGPIQEHVIDEFVAGRLSRRDFIRRGSMLGMSMGVLSGILAACGSSGPSSSSSTPTGTGKSGATIKAGIIVPAGAINPITISDQGGLELIGNVGEFLVYTDPVTLLFRPWLATSWSPNADASVWTFKIRQGVKFNDGKPMTVDDVVYSFKQQTNPKGSGNALSVFAGTLTPDGVEKVDDTTVAFHLESPDAGWPYAVSQNNYNMIIVPNGFDFGTYQKNWPGHDEQLHRERRGGVRAEPALLGDRGAARQGRVDLLPDRGADGGRAAGGLDRRHGPVLGRHQPAAADRRLQRHQPEGGHAPSAVDAQRHRSVHEQAGAPGARVFPRPAGDRGGPVQGPGRGRERQPVRAGVPVDRHERAAADAEHIEGQVAAGPGRGRARVLDAAAHRGHPGDPALRPDRQAVRRADRGDHQRDHRGPVEVLRPVGAREVGLAGRRDEPGRLRRTRGPEHISEGAAANDQRQDRAGRLERRPLQQLHLRQALEAVHRHAGPVDPAADRRADPEAAARRDPDHLRVLLQLPERLGEERHRHHPDGAGPVLPVERDQELSATENA